MMRGHNKRAVSNRSRQHESNAIDKIDNHIDKEPLQSKSGSINKADEYAWFVLRQAYQRGTREPLPNAPIIHVKDGKALTEYGASILKAENANLGKWLKGKTT